MTQTAAKQVRADKLIRDPASELKPKKKKKEPIVALEYRQSFQPQIWNSQIGNDPIVPSRIDQSIAAQFSEAVPNEAFQGQMGVPKDMEISRKDVEGYFASWMGKKKAKK